MADARRVGLGCACAALLAGPTILAFFAGGYFTGPRAVAGIVAWALVAFAALASPQPLRGLTRSGWVAIAGLALFATWTLVSFTWSPVAGTAYHDGQRVFLYLGALVASVLLFGQRRRLVEPALAAGTLVVVGYGISERLLPALLHFHHSASAQGRLEQPLTYWNAMGALAALGLVLTVSLAGAGSRPRVVRAAAAAGCAPLGLGLYVSFSRGALFAAAAGVLTLVVLRPDRATLRGVIAGGGAAVLSGALAAPLPWVTNLGGSPGARTVEGLVALAGLGVFGAIAAGLVLRAPRGEPARPLPLPARAGRLAVLVVAGAFVVFLAIGAKERSAAPLASGATRLTTLQSNRYSYWKVAWRAFDAEPVRGVGGGGWAVYWLRYRTIASGAQDAHSLPIQTLAELGLVGLALLAVFLAGVGTSAHAAVARSPRLAAGPAAALVAWGFHSLIDWDWEMPALTLVAVLLAGFLVRLGARSAVPLASPDDEPRPGDAEATRGVTLASGAG